MAQSRVRVSIPAPKKRKLLERAWFVALVALGPPVLAGIIAIGKELSGVGTVGAPVASPSTSVAAPASSNTNVMSIPGPSRPVWLIPGLVVGVVWLTGAGLLLVLQKYREDAAEDDAESGIELKGCLHVIYRTVAEMKGLDAQADKKRLRVSLLRVENDELVQCFDYIGGDGGGMGRRFPIHSGIIGHVARNGVTHCAKRSGATYEDYLNELTTSWGMTLDQAKAVQIDRLAWLGVPIKGASASEIIGVVYLDSDQRDFFDPDAKDVSLDVEKLVLSASKGMAAFIRECYS